MGLVRLAWRQLQTSWGVLAVLGIVTLIAAGVLATVPRALSDTHTEQTRYEIGTASGIARDAVAAYNGFTPGADSAVPDGTSVPKAPDWDSFLGHLDAVRDTTTEPLRSMLGTPDFSATATEGFEVEPVASTDLSETTALFRATPTLADHSELLEGRWPEPTRYKALVVDEYTLTPLSPHHPATSKYPIEVAVSQAVAERFDWEAGGRYQQLRNGPWFGEYRTIHVTGVFTVDDPTADYWQHHSRGAEPTIVVDPNRGVLGTAAVYVDPAMIGPLTLGGEASTRMWFPISADSLTEHDVETALGQLHGFSAGNHTVSAGSADPSPIQIRPESRLTDVLERLLSQRNGVNAIVAVLAAGPAGATIAVLALGARLIVDRRRRALVLLRARGASGRQVRALMAGEGLAIGLPSAAAGFLLGLAVVPAPVTITQILLALLAGLAPAAALALSASPSSLRQGRTDVTPRSRSSLRWVAEVVVIVGAGLSTWLLLSRGVVAGAGDDQGIDPLVAIAPFLVALAGAVIAVRVYPWLAVAVERILARRRDLVPFLGAARATRDPAGGPVPAIALVLATSVAAMSAVLFTTVSGGVATEAWRSTGADLRIAGHLMTGTELNEVSEMDGIDAVTLVQSTDDAEVAGDSGDSSDLTTEVVTADIAALAKAQANVPDVPDAFPQLSVSGSNSVPVMMTPTLAEDVGTSDLTLTLRGREAPIEVVEVAELPGVTTEDASMLIDAETLAAFGEEHDWPEQVPSSRLAVAALAESADHASIRDQLESLLPKAVVTDAAERADGVRDAPVTHGLALAFPVAALLAAGLCALAVAMSLMLAAPARARLLAVLRTLGLTGRQRRGLVAWEIGPSTLIALIVGAVIGVAVPRLVLGAVEVTALTGGDARPDVQYDPVLLGAGVAGLLVVVIAAIAVAVAVGRRGEIASHLRMGNDE